MKTIIASLLLVISATAAFAAESFAGTFLYKYKGGSTYRVTIPDAEKLHWECIEGDEKGAKGDEKPTRYTVADGIYFASWVEKTGIVVTQVVNMKTSKVYSTIVEGKDRFVLEGDVTKE